jgi:hypothetical protein
MPTITLTNGATTLALPDDLIWADEFAWSAVQQRSGYSAGGALLLDVGFKLAGRPITLQGGESHAWAPRSTALTLKQWIDAGASPLTLLFRGTPYTVGFATVDEPLSVQHLADCSDPDTVVAGGLGEVETVFFTLRLITLG